MAGVNKVILVGNLGKDPEIRHLENGRAVVNFPIATSETYKTRDGERVTKTEWHNVVVWRQLAELAEQYLKKGSKVYIEGQLETRKWQDQSGQDRYSTEVVLRPFTSTLTMLDGRSEEQSGTSDPRRSQEPEGYGAPARGLDGDEIPFFYEWRI